MLSYSFWKSACYFLWQVLSNWKIYFFWLKVFLKSYYTLKYFQIQIYSPNKSNINLSCCFLFLFFLLCHKVWEKRICADVFNEYILVAIFTSYQVFLPNLKLTIAQNSILKHISVIKFEPIVAMRNTCR